MTSVSDRQLENGWEELAEFMILFYEIVICWHLYELSTYQKNISKYIIDTKGLLHFSK